STVSRAWEERSEDFLSCAMLSLSFAMYQRTDEYRTEKVCVSWRQNLLPRSAATRGRQSLQDNSSGGPPAPACGSHVCVLPLWSVSRSCAASGEPGRGHLTRDVH